MEDPPGISTCSSRIMDSWIFRMIVVEAEEEEEEVMLALKTEVRKNLHRRNTACRCNRCRIRDKFGYSNNINSNSSNKIRNNSNSIPSIAATTNSLRLLSVCLLIIRRFAANVPACRQLPPTRANRQHRLDITPPGSRPSLWARRR